MTRHGKIPATVITGFLGAGKTSMIRHLLEQAQGKRLALIINEFGDLGVDGEIVKGCGIEGCDEGDVLELANGCICCTVADDFVPTMEKLLDRDAPPDHIVIETSGLALPKPLVKAFNWPEIRTRVTVDGVIAVVDADALAAGRFAQDPSAVQAQREADDSLDHESPLEELFEDQLACADLVVMNKADLLEANRLEGLRAEILADIRPGAKVVNASHGALAPSLVLGLSAAAESDLDSRPSHHDAEEEHDHDDFTSFALTLDQIADPEELLPKLNSLVRAHDILRIKGFAAVKDKDMRLLIQGVGPRLQYYYDRDWRAEEARLTQLVFIGEQGMDQVAIAQALRGEGAA